MNSWTKVVRAMFRLQALISEGYEWADAIFRVADDFDLTSEEEQEVVRLYDEDCDQTRD